MPIDPRIPLMLDTSQRKTATGVLGDFFKQREAAQAEQEKKRRQQDIAQIVQSSGGDYDQAIKALRERGYVDESLALEKNVWSARKSAVDVKTAQTENDMKLLSRGRQIAQTIVDQDSLARGRQMLQQIGAESLVQHLPDQFDPATTPKVIQQIVSAGMTHENYLKTQRQALDDFAKGDIQKAVGNAFSAADDPESWETTYANMEDIGVPKSILSMIPRQFSEDARKRSAALTMTPGERFDNETARFSAETSRFNADTSRMSAETARQNAERAGQMSDVSDAAFINRHIQSRAGNKPIGSLSPREFNQYHAEAMKLLAEQRRAPREGEQTDDPALPNGVKQHLNEIAQRHETFAAAEQEMLGSLPGHFQSHKRLDPKKAREYLEALYGKKTGITGEPEYSTRTPQPQAPAQQGVNRPAQFTRPQDGATYHVGQIIPLRDGRKIRVKAIGPDGKIIDYDIVQ